MKILISILLLLVVAETTILALAISANHNPWNIYHVNK